MSADREIGTPVHNHLGDLFAQYLKRQASASSEGLDTSAAEAEVTPYDAGPVQPIDPRLAWDGALAALTFFRPDVSLKALARPADWANLVSLHEPAAGLALAVGNFPQLMRSVQPLLNTEDLRTLRPAARPALHAPDLLSWAADAGRKQFPQPLLALGMLRLARQFEAAAELARRLQKSAPGEWQLALGNEQAALAWHAGRADEAIQLWDALPESVPVLLNRGMAALFSHRPAHARPALRHAVRDLPDDTAWHHMGRLYLALADTR